MSPINIKQITEAIKEETMTYDIADYQQPNKKDKTARQFHQVKPIVQPIMDRSNQNALRYLHQKDDIQMTVPRNRSIEMNV